MSNFQKIYDEEFYLMFVLPSQAGRVLAGLLKHSQNKDTHVKDGFRFKSCYPSQTTLAAFFGVTERTIRKGVKQLEEHQILKITTEGRRNIYTIYYPIGMGKLQDYLEKIQDQMNLCSEKIQDQLCKNIGSTATQIQDQLQQEYRINCNSKKTSNFENHPLQVDTKPYTEQMLKEKRKEKREEKRKEEKKSKYNISDLPDLRM
jgi:hypothetical protein